MATFGTFVAGQTLTAAELNSGGAFSSYTPTLTQDVAVAKTVNWARYMQFGKFVYVSLSLTASASGTANNKVFVGLPVSASANNFVLGNAILDLQRTQDGATYYGRFQCLALYESSTTMSFWYTSTNQTAANTFSTASRADRVGQNGIILQGSVDFGQIVSGSTIYAEFIYEAA
jgi:hypothetical protein